MSHIFEALQRAEAERSGVAAPPPAESVADLLHAADLLATADADLENQGHDPLAEPEPSPEAERGSDSFAAAKVLTPTPAKDSRLVCLTDPGSMGAEQFRVLGLKLRAIREKRQLRRVVITSTIPVEGKSTIAANLALNQARSKVLKTLLVDGDLRRPSLASRFGLSRTLPGLTECLRGERHLSEVVYKLGASNLWFTPAGLPPENPLELMQSGRVADLLDRMGTFFDWIIIDSPPLIPLADTALWMKLADGVLLVAREGISEKKPLKRALEALDPAMLLGVIVNSCSGDHKNYYQRYSPLAVQSQEDTSPSS
jgi:capsular exopolysaccharide synthesis family protein